MSEQVFERANHRHDAFFVAGFAATGSAVLARVATV